MSYLLSGVAHQRRDSPRSTPLGFEASDDMFASSLSFKYMVPSSELPTIIATARMAIPARALCVLSTLAWDDLRYVLYLGIRFERGRSNVAKMGNRQHRKLTGSITYDRVTSSEETDA